MGCKMGLDMRQIGYIPTDEDVLAYFDHGGLLFVCIDLLIAISHEKNDPWKRIARGRHGSARVMS